MNNDKIDKVYLVSLKKQNKERTLLSWFSTVPENNAITNLNKVEPHRIRDLISQIDNRN